MKTKQLITLCLTSLILVSCSGELSNQQLISTPTNAVTDISPTQGNGSAPSDKSAKETTIKSGKFVAGEHQTQGTVRITRKEGKSFLELDSSFKTSNSGPDLVVILHRSANIIAATEAPSYPLKKGDYIVIAPLEKFNGAQSYLIPNNINLAEYKSAAIWCRKFNATFGAASLSN